MERLRAFGIMNAYPSAEIRPALDETRPAIGPNLAGNEALCKAVAEHIYSYFYPYMLQQQRLWDTWRRMDDAWRVKGRRDDLDISYTDPASRNKNPDGKGDGITDTRDGVSAKIYPAAFHKQVRSKTDMHMSIAWADGLPARAMKPKTVYEHPLYNPTTQGVDSANELLRQCAEAVELKRRDRKVRGSWSKYGHAWVHVDFKYRLQDVPQVYVLPQNPEQAMALLQAVSQMFGDQQPQWGVGPSGERTAVFVKRTVDPDSMVTDFQPIRHDAVFIDQTLSADDMEAQQCPLICEHVTVDSLWGNDYDPETNPFGWLNCRRALADGQAHYTLSDQSEGSFRQELAKKFGLNDSGMLTPRQSMKQRWTAYPRLAIDPQTQMLVGPEGMECPLCRGAKTIDVPVMQGGEPQQFSTLPVEQPAIMGAEATPQIAQMRQPCPECEGLGRKYIEPRRFVVQGFGLLSTGASHFTVLRIQPNPTVKNRVPLIYGAHLTEDTAGAIPLSVSEASLSSNDQLATGHNQFLNAKNAAINPPWKVQRDEFEAMAMDLNRPNRNIALDNVNNAVPAERPTVDATTTLIPYIQMMEGEVQDIHGIPDVLLGMVSGGRRAATQIQTASDAAKLPITVEIDSCNTQIHGRWAQFHLDNLEAYADRDWIQRRTGRTTFGKLQLHTAVAADFFTEQAKLQLLQNTAPMFASDPRFNLVRAGQALFEMAGFDDAGEFFDDGGQRKAQMDALKIVTRILGDGEPVMPTPSDPHALYVQVFQEALKDPWWQERTPENLPLLAQRLQIQQTMQQEQEMMQMQQQMNQQALLGIGPDGKPARPNNGQRPPNGSKIPGNATQSRQQSAGRSAPQRN